MRWITENDESAADICVHGDVEFEVNGEVLVEPAKAENLTVSAAALYLMRTLTASHTREAPLCELLFPCCGRAMWDIEGQCDVLITGCGSGEDFEIRHQQDGSGVVIRAHDGREWSVGTEEWQVAVMAFADSVAEFYSRHPRRKPSTEDKPGFAKFLSEWERRRGERIRFSSSPWWHILKRRRHRASDRLEM